MKAQEVWPITLGKIMTEQVSAKKQNFSANLSKTYFKHLLQIWPSQAWVLHLRPKNPKFDNFYYFQLQQEKIDILPLWLSIITPDTKKKVAWAVQELIQSHEMLKK